MIRFSEIVHYPKDMNSTSLHNNNIKIRVNKEGRKEESLVSHIGDSHKMIKKT